MKEVQVLTEQYQQAYNRIRLHTAGTPGRNDC